MADPIIPTPQDSKLLLQDTVTKTASYNASAKDLGIGYAPGGVGQPVAMVVLVTAVDTTSGDEAYTFTLQESPDNLSWSSAGPGTNCAAVGTLAVRGMIRQRYVRLALAASGTTPSVTFKAWINPLP